MPTDLATKLRRLGVHKGVPPLKPPRERGGRQGEIEGRAIDTPHGPAFVHEETYTIDHPHGEHFVGDVLSLSPAGLARMLPDDSLTDLDLSRAVFLDTETTGLSGGTGTLVFLIGVGAFNIQHSTFYIRQFFLRSPSEEAAMLHALAEHLDAFDAVVSFNGRGFDLPLLDARFRLARMRPRILRAPHLDLLPPARRMWRGRLASCALSALERAVLGVQRDQADVPGELIPGLYFNYIQTGDASEMPRVMYHNAIDILSMVTLSARLMTLLDSPHATGRNAGDLLAIGKWRDQLGQSGEAEAALRDCLNADPDPATRFTALHRLGHLLKRLERRAEAVPLWEAVSESRTLEGVEACVELAKYYEWHAVDLDRAIVFTRKAMTHARRVTPDILRDPLEADLAHRLTRLARKRA